MFISTTLSRRGLRKSELSMEEGKAFRMLAARLNYVSQDNLLVAVASEGHLQEHG